MDQVPLPADLLNDAAQWAQFLEGWARLVSHTDHPAQQRWRDEIEHWTEISIPAESRDRAVRVMGKLRHAAPREYDVLYRALVIGESFEEIAQWLDTRAKRLGISLPEGQTEHYVVKDATALFVAGVFYVRSQL